MPCCMQVLSHGSHECFCCCCCFCYCIPRRARIALGATNGGKVFFICKYQDNPNCKSKIPCYPSSLTLKHLVPLSWGIQQPETCPASPSPNLIPKQIFQEGQVKRSFIVVIEPERKYTLSDPSRCTCWTVSLQLAEFGEAEVEIATDAARQRAGPCSCCRWWKQNPLSFYTIN